MVQANPARLQRTVGIRARTHDVIGDALVEAVQHGVCAAAAFDQARHDAMQRVVDDLRGAAEQVRFATVPQGQQDVTVAGHEDAGLRILSVARFALHCNCCGRIAAHQRQLHDVGTLA